jgi:hypothetical protein
MRIKKTKQPLGTLLETTRPKEEASKNKLGLDESLICICLYKPDK